MTPSERFPIGSRWQRPGGLDVVHVICHDVACGRTFAHVDYVVDGSCRGKFWYWLDDLATWTRLEDAPAEPAPAGPPWTEIVATIAQFVATHKPAPLCEAPGWLGREHAVDATEYGVCRVCGASESDRRAVRRRAFEANTVTYATGSAETVFVASHAADPDDASTETIARAPTRKLAVEELWQKLEAGR